MNAVLDAAEKWEMERYGDRDYLDTRYALTHAVDALDNALWEIENDDGR